MLRSIKLYAGVIENAAMRGPEKNNHANLAGIVPIAGKNLDFGLPWHDAMMPLANDYCAFERAIFECACAGCRSIWVICHREMKPIFRNRVGRYVRDPLVHTKYRSFPKDFRTRYIPLYFVPVSPADRDERDNLGWTALWGCYAASRLLMGLSGWGMPSRFYIAFPYGAYDPRNIIQHRSKVISPANRNFRFVYNGKTAQNDSEYLGCTVLPSDINRCSNSFRKKEPSIDVTSELNEVFSAINRNTIDIEMDWYYNIDNWDGYKTYLGSEHSKLLVKPEEITVSREKSRILDA